MSGGKVWAKIDNDSIKAKKKKKIHWSKKIFLPTYLLCDKTWNILYKLCDNIWNLSFTGNLNK